jgi:hypothetical protein
MILLFTMVQPAKISSEPLIGLRFGEEDSPELPFVNIQLARFIKGQHIGNICG